MSNLALELIAKEKIEKTGKLDLGHCDLRELPEALFELTWLEELNVCDAYYDYEQQKLIDSQNKGNQNKLSIISNNIEQLQNLKILRLNGSYNTWEIKDISPLEKLPNLTSLDLSFNQISDIRFLEN
jgi:Leucine-rich repeat (LRR) protein